MQKLALSLLAYKISICRLSPDALVPGWAINGRFFSITRTAEELSIVCETDRVPGGVQQSPGWRGLRVEGPLDFALVGILAGISEVLARASVSLFAISTYDTDIILVREKDLNRAVAALNTAGYIVRSEPAG